MKPDIIARLQKLSEMCKTEVPMVRTFGPSTCRDVQDEIRKLRVELGKERGRP